MLEIRELQDTEKYSEVFKRLGGKSDEYRVVESFGHDHEVNGYAVYSLSPEAVIIHEADFGKDILLGDGILRAVLFKACLKGTECGICLACDGDTNLFEKMKYETSEPGKISPISSFLDGCSKCKEMR